MKNVNLIVLFFFFLINNFVSSDLGSEINNRIVVKVGNLVITSIDLENEIVTNLLINRREITQENINNNKNYAIKNLISKSIKKSEIKKYEIKNYSEKDLENYIRDVAKNLSTNTTGLKEIFNQTGVNYELFVEKHEIELLWNTLIFNIYKNQININIFDVENEVKKIEENKNREITPKIKQDILNKKKQEKLELFSRSHFSNLENTVNVDFQ